MSVLPPAANLTVKRVETKGKMIHMLKANTKPIGTEYKRRIVPIASTLADFQAN